MYMKTISALAVVKSYQDRGYDYIDNFIPLLVHIIKQQDLKQIHVEEIIKYFNDIYGFEIPYHGILTLLNRAKRRGYLKKEGQALVPIIEKIDEDDFSIKSAEQTRKINQIVSDLISFANSSCSVQLSTDQAEKLLFNFIKVHDIDILLSKEKYLAGREDNAQQQYVLGKYFEKIYNENQIYFDYIIDIALANATLDAIIFEDFNNYICELKGMNCFLDVGIIYRLLGTDGGSQKKFFIDFIEALRTSGAKLYLFTHNYDEIINNLDVCKEWINNPLLDPKKASRSLLYFISKNYSISDIDLFIAEIKPILDRFSITLADKPPFLKNKLHQIDERVLRQYIIKIYTEFDPQFNYTEHEQMIDKDVDSISAIYRLRKGRIFHLFKDATNIFITANCGLAIATSTFEKQSLKVKAIPASVTDIFLGTMLWVSNPQKYKEVSRKLIISDIAGSFNINDKLHRRYLKEIKILKERGVIGAEEYYYMRSGSLALKLLEDKTLNDPNNFTDRTAEEIFEEIKEKIQAPERSKYIAEKLEHDKTKDNLEKTLEERNTASSEAENLRKAIDKIAVKSAQIIITIATIIILPILLVGIFWELCKNVVEKYIPIPHFGLICLVILGLAVASHLIFDMPLKKLKSKIESYLAVKIKIYLENKFIKK